jgi:hypothetical protein
MEACQYGVYSRDTKSGKKRKGSKARKNPLSDETDKKITQSKLVEKPIQPKLRKRLQQITVDS